jgi:uncharacterized coiled-coil protein SlyX
MGGQENTTQSNSTYNSQDRLDHRDLVKTVNSQSQDIAILKNNVEGLREDVTEVKGRLEKVTDRLDRVTIELHETTVSFTAQTNKVINSLSDALVSSRRVEAEQITKCDELDMLRAKIDADRGKDKSGTTVAIVKEVVKILVALVAGLFGGGLIGGGK